MDRWMRQRRRHRMLQWHRLGLIRQVGCVVVVFQLFIVSYCLVRMYEPRGGAGSIFSFPFASNGGGDESYLSPLDKFKLSNETLTILSRVANIHGFVNIQLLSASFVEMTLSWICNVRKLEGDVMAQTVFFATDERSKMALLKFDPSIQIVREQHEQLTALKYGEESYFAFMLWRTEIIMELLELGLSFMLTEADALWLKNPFIMMGLPEGDYDIMVMDDRMTNEKRRKLPNGGFIYFSATDRTRLAWREVLLRQRKEMQVFALRKRGKKKHFRNEQVFEASVFKKRAKNGWLRLLWLPKTHYYSGMFYAVAGMNLTKPGYEPYVILNNFALNAQIKVSRAIQHNHWFTKPYNGTVQCVYLPPRLVRLEKVYGTCRHEDVRRIAYMDKIPPFGESLSREHSRGMLHMNTLGVVERIAKEHGFVNVVFVHYAVTSAAFSWICNARKLGGNVLQLTMFVAVDAKAHQALMGFDPSLNIVFEPFSVLLQGKLLHSVSISQFRTWRWKVMQELLDAHVSLLRTEVTSLWLKNPIPVIGIPRTPYDIVLLDKNMKKRHRLKLPSSSFMFFKSSDATRAALQALFQEEPAQESWPAQSEERLIKAMVDRLTPIGNVTSCWAPLEKFYSVTAGALRAKPIAKKREIVVVSNVQYDKEVNIYLAHHPGYYMFDGSKCVKAHDNLAKQHAAPYKKPLPSASLWSRFRMWGR